MTTNEFVAALNEKFNSNGYHFDRASSGVKYTRIVATRSGQRSVYCFTDALGGVYKAASWKGPAKGVRATLATLDMAKVDAYGSWLYR